MKKALKQIFILCLIFLLIPMSVTALAAEEDVILISTPAQLDAIRENPEGHYRLANDIDMAGYYDFEPIGNEVDGPFTGVLDGAGYTIRNLELRYDSYKYVGLFGYLDGTVMNLTLEDIVVEAARYDGGLAGYADGNSRIEGITVSGSVTANSTYFTQYAGGILGYAVCGISDCTNYAVVDDLSVQNKDDYMGGIAAYVGGDVTGCVNYSDLSYRYSYTYISISGIAHQCDGNITGCTNYGNIYGYDIAAGISAKCAGTISDCTNRGNVIGSYTSYGIGSAYAIRSCSSTGNVGSRGTTNTYGIGYATSTIENCFVTGLLGTGNSSVTLYPIGVGNLKNSYAVVSMTNTSYFCQMSGGEKEGCMTVVLNWFGSSNYSSMRIDRNNLCIYRATAGSLYLGNYLLGTDGTLEQIARKYDDLDYEMNWTRDENWFSGLPIPANLPEYLELSDIVLILDRQESARLKARIGTTEVTDLTWTSADEAIATVNENGLVTAWGEVGTRTVISATTDDGLRMDCLVIISDGMPQSVSISPSSAQSLRVGRTFQFTAATDAMATTGTQITWSSSNESVATVDQNGLVTTHAIGNATITARTVNGKTASANVNVTYAADLILETEEVMVPYKQTVYIPYTLSPAGATDGLTVTSSNTSYVSVNHTTQSGRNVISITGYNHSSTTSNACQTVTVTTTGGVTKTIRVTVVDHEFSYSSYSVNVNKTQAIALTKYPTDFEQRITWTSSDETIATVDENGVVTGIRPGAVTITATSEYGTVRTCTVTVTNYANELYTDRSDIHMLVNTTDQISAWMIPANCTSGLSYNSSNTNVVTVNSAGQLTAKSTGSAVITVTASGSGVKTSFSVTVVSTAVPATDLEISTEELNMYSGDVAYLSATAIPGDTTDSRVIWSSSDETVATVARGGVVKAVSGGTATITATLPNGLSRSCTVKVRSNEKMDISLPTINAFPGETIEIPVCMDRNPGTAAMRLKISYDSELLIPDGLTKGDMLSGITITDNTETDGEWVILWSAPADVEETGTMFTLFFAVPEDAPVNSEVEIAVAYEPGDIVDAEHVELLPTITNGVVQIREMLSGDVYEDRMLNSHDILLLQQYLTELVDFTDHQLLLGDLDRNDDVSMGDLVMLAQKLVSPSVTSDTLNSGEDDPADPFTVTVGEEVLGQDGTVSLPVVFSGCPGISAFKFHISYDENLYELESIQGCSEEISAALMVNTETPGDAVVTWYSDMNQDLDGEVLVLHFRLSEGAEAQSSMVFLDCTYGDLCRENLEELDPELVPGEIRVPLMIASGWSGDTTWVLTDDGVLTFTGSGKIKSYDYNAARPWDDYADQITSVIVEEGITCVGSCAFMGVENLESVELPESLTHMGEAAFYGTGLTAVEIPAALWTIQPYTFKNCTNLTSVTFHEGNLEKISDGAFYGTGLTELVLPDCLKILDTFAFKGCANLTSITIGDGLTELREAVFYGTAIPTITIPEGITKIGPYAFKNCVALETVDMPSTLTSVGEASFYADTALRIVELPETVSEIGNYAFRKCESIETLKLSEELITVGECAFYGCTSLTELVIPDKVTTIKPYAFKTCTGLTSVTLGDSVQSIGEGAFNTCTGLKTLVFPASLKEIGDYAFANSENLWKLTFQGDAPSIGTGAFKGLEAEAWYPGENATWTSANMLNYGGKITWRAD